VAFHRSTGGERLGEPPQHEPAPPEIRERDGIAVLVGEGEVGGRGALSQHTYALRRSRARVYAGRDHGLRNRSRGGTARTAPGRSPGSSASWVGRSAGRSPGTIEGPRRSWSAGG